MGIRALRLWNLRNHGQSLFMPSPTTTLLVGANGSGKTTVLEAAALFATLRTPRASSLSQLVSEGTDEGGAHLECDEGVPLEVRIRGGRSLLRAGGSGASARTFLGRFRAVLFTPEDLDVVRGEPELRRRTLDDLITQQRPAYREVRRDFERALRQRNAAIRQGLAEEASVYDGPLAAAGAQVLDRRRETVDALRPAAVELYKELAGRGELEVAYRDTSGVGDLTGAELVEHLHERYRAEVGKHLERGRTTLGPHRDDLDLTVDGRPARTHASRGEQRSAALALRLSELRVLPDAILLLDDVLSELDPDRRERVFRSATGVQTVVTATDDRPVPSTVTVEARWSVSAGVLRGEG